MPWLLLPLGAYHCTAHIYSSVWFYFGLEFICKRLDIVTEKRYEKSSHSSSSFQKSLSLPFTCKCVCCAQLCFIPWIWKTDLRSFIHLFFGKNIAAPFDEIFFIAPTRSFPCQFFHLRFSASRASGKCTSGQATSGALVAGDQQAACFDD